MEQITTFERFVKADTEAYEKHGMKMVSSVDAVFIYKALSEPSFVNAYNALTLSNKTELTLSQLDKLFQAHNIRWKITMYEDFEDLRSNPGLLNKVFNL